MRIVIQLGYMCNAADARAAVDLIFRELDEMMATLHVVVTLSCSHFMLMCAQPVLTPQYIDEDDDDDVDDDYHREDHGDDNAQAGNACTSTAASNR